MSLSAWVFLLVASWLCCFVPSYPVITFALSVSSTVIILVSLTSQSPNTSILTLFSFSLHCLYPALRCLLLPVPFRRSAFPGILHLGPLLFSLPSPRGWIWVSSAPSLGCNVALSDCGSRRLLESRLQLGLHLAPACKALGNEKQRARTVGCLDSCQSAFWSGLAGLAVASASTPWLRPHAAGAQVLRRPRCTTVPPACASGPHRRSHSVWVWWRPSIRPPHLDLHLALQPTGYPTPPAAAACRGEEGQSWSWGQLAGWKEEGRPLSAGAPWWTCFVRPAPNPGSLAGGTR